MSHSRKKALMRVLMVLLICAAGLYVYTLETRLENCERKIQALE